MNSWFNIMSQKCCAAVQRSECLQVWNITWSFQFINMSNTCFTSKRRTRCCYNLKKEKVNLFFKNLLFSKCCARKSANMLIKQTGVSQYAYVYSWSSEVLNTIWRQLVWFCSDNDIYEFKCPKLKNHVKWIKSVPDFSKLLITLHFKRRQKKFNKILHLQIKSDMLK